VTIRRTIPSHLLRTGLTLLLISLLTGSAQGQTVTSAAARVAVPAAPGKANPVWTLKLKQDLRWQQVTPAGTLLISTDDALTGIDIDRGQVIWEKPELGGLPPDSVRIVEGSILMEAARPGLLLIFDPVTGSVVFDSRRLGLADVVTRRVLPQTGTLLVHGRRPSGPPVVALYDLVSGDQRWASESLFVQTEPKKKGLGGLVQGLVQKVSEATALEVLQAGPDMIVVHTLMGLRGLDARSGELRWSTALATARPGNPAKHVRLYPSVDQKDRIYVSFDDRLMAYHLSDGKPVWAQPATVNGWIHDIVQHPAGIIILPEAAPEGELSGSRTVINGVVQTGLNVARYEDGKTVAAKPVKMRGNVTDALVAGESAVLAVDAESKTFLNVLDVASATLRLKKDVKIKGRLDYAELNRSGLLYVTRPDVGTNAEVNFIDLNTGERGYKDAIESGKPMSSTGYNADRYRLLHATEGRTMYVFANKNRQLYAVDRETGTFEPRGGEIRLDGGEDPVDMEIRREGIVLIAPQNLVILGRDGQVKKQVYYPAPQLSGLLRALHGINAVRAGLYGAAASAYGDAFADASRRATDATTKQITSQLATAYSEGGAQLQGYAHQSAAMATRRFKASLTVPSSVFMLTKSPEGKGNVLLQIDKVSAEPRARIDLGKDKEPVYAVDDIAGMLFLRTGPGTIAGYRL
jgi:outer membrane protein assembly factor BamB